MNDFENTVLDSLKKCIPDLTAVKNIGAAVSGGADSVSLLFSLAEISKQYDFNLKVITVNHNIREEKETSGDALYVKTLCEQLKKNGFNIECRIANIERGYVFSLAEKRAGGIEEAARTVRYEEFEKFIKENNLDYLCLAHNQNDQLETLLMRFLQGSSLEGNIGINSVRGKYIRPLLEITRNHIEKYLNEKNIKWRTDKTNFDDSYLRNRIRNNLIPVLDKNFEGWKKSVINGANKFTIDNQFIEEISENFCKENFIINDKDENAEVCVSVEKFNSLNRAIKSRVLYNLFNIVGENTRIPFTFIEEICYLLEEKNQKEFSKRFNTVQIICKKNNLFVKKYVKTQTDLVFFDIIKETGTYEIYGYKFDVTENELHFGDSTVKNITFPLSIRNYCIGDVVKCSDGKMKKLNDVFSDWHVEQNVRNTIPVVEELSSKEQNIIAVFGKFFGYKDWIV